MKIYYFVFLIFILVPRDIMGQVFTRVLGEEESISDYVPWYFNESPRTFELPVVDKEQILSQDKILNRSQPRLAIKQDLFATKKEGVFYKGGNYWVWKINLQAFQAKSLSLHLENFNLPESAIAYIYNEESKYIIGPFSNKDIYGGLFNSDYINGDQLTLDIFFRADNVDEFEVDISSFNYGITSLEAGVVDSDFASSGDCNVNVACPEGQGWENQSNSVCKIIHSSIGSCSGALVNNECNDLTPNILTADHCVTEASIAEYIFRFNYQSFVCEHNGNSDGTEPNQNLWITYSGATFRSSWALPNTDFALVELLSTNVGGLSFSGWDRNGSPSIGTPTVIHHPSGDVKKISIDNESASDDDEFNWFVDDWDVGTTEGGSSGAPLYGDLGLIVGINSTGDGFYACDVEKGTFFGKFSRSWDGNGTNTTSLAPWLGNTNNPMLLNGIDDIPEISGPDILCVTPRTYILNNMLQGYNVSWVATPANLLSSAINGTGVVAILRGRENVRGRVTLTYTLENNDCGILEFSKNIWVGKPAVPQVEIPDCFPIGSNVVLKVKSEGATSYTWTFPNCPSGPVFGDPNSDCWFNYTGDGLNNQIFVYVGEQGGSVSVWASNECGSSSINIPINFCDRDDGPFHGGPNIRSGSNIEDLNFRIFPNPTSKFITIETKEVGAQLFLYNTQGKLLKEIPNLSNIDRIDLEGLPIGVYYVVFQSISNREIRKIVKK